MIKVNNLIKSGLLLILVTFKIEAQTSSLAEGDSLYIRGNYTKAIEVYKQYQHQDIVFQKIAKASIALGNYDNGLAYYKKALQSFPDDELIMFEYARLLSKVKKFKEASDVYYQLIDIDYKNPNYHYEIGLVLEHLKDSTAQNRYWNAFQLDKTHQKAIFKIAKYHLIKGANKQVDYYVDIGLESYANNKELISLKAQNYFVRKDYENAVIWFEKLISLNESSQFIHEKLSVSYSRLFEFEKAIEQSLLALKFETTNTNNLFILGQLYDRVSDFVNAEKYLLESIRLQDVALDNEYVKLARVYNLQKKQKEAIDAFLRAIDENPKNEQAHFFLVLTKNQYYANIESKIEAFEGFKTKFPESMFVQMANNYIKKLKEEQFLKED